VTHVDAAKGDVARTKADVTRIGEALGWEPRTSLDEGLARMWSWASGRVAAG
jgi:nucleoside-diphosphate-sugar epimerase